MYCFDIIIYLLFYGVQEKKVKILHLKLLNIYFTQMLDKKCFKVIEGLFLCLDPFKIDCIPFKCCFLFFSLALSNVFICWVPFCWLLLLLLLANIFFLSFNSFLGLVEIVVDSNTDGILLFNLFFDVMARTTSWFKPENLSFFFFFLITGFSSICICSLGFINGLWTLCLQTPHVTT